MAATVAQPSVKTPAPAPFPEMNARELAEFRAAVQMLRAERALREASAAGSAAILAAAGPGAVR